MTIHALKICLITFFVMSCDYEQRASGIILNRGSKRPVADVKIEKGFSADPDKDHLPRYYSDMLGNFEVRYHTTYLLFSPDLKLSFSKKGFVTNKISLKGRTQKDTIYLDPKE